MINDSDGKSFEIDGEWAGKSIKSFLYGFLHLSRAQVIILKKTERGILLDGQPAFVTALLQDGSILSLKLADSGENEKIVPTDLPLDVLFEDEYLIAVNKPPFMPTHPSLHHYTDTLANALAHYFEQQNRPFVFRCMNRLDRDTSGVVLIAKDKHTAFQLSKIIMERRADKRYIALLEGTLEGDCGTIDKNILRENASIIRRRTDELLGEKAITTYSVLERKAGLTLVCAAPLTGRTHQLRVHFSSIGHPILGDDLYGTSSPQIGRQALHAHRLTLEHPATRQMLELVAPLPEDMKKVLKENCFETIF